MSFETIPRTSKSILIPWQRREQGLLSTINFAQSLQYYYFRREPSLSSSVSNKPKGHIFSERFQSHPHHGGFGSNTNINTKAKQKGVRIPVISEQLHHSQPELRDQSNWWDNPNQLLQSSVLIVFIDTVLLPSTQYDLSLSGQENKCRTNSFGNPSHSPTPENTDAVTKSCQRHLSCLDTSHQSNHPKKLTLPFFSGSSVCKKDSIRLDVCVTQQIIFLPEPLIR